MMDATSLFVKENELILMWLLGVYAGWSLHDIFSMKKICFRYYRLGLLRGLVFWSKVMNRRQKRKARSNER